MRIITIPSHLLIKPEIAAAFPVAHLHVNERCQGIALRVELGGCVLIVPGELLHISLSAEKTAATEDRRPSLTQRNSMRH